MPQKCPTRVAGRRRRGLPKPRIDLLQDLVCAVDVSLRAPPRPFRSAAEAWGISNLETPHVCSSEVVES